MSNQQIINAIRGSQQVNDAIRQFSSPGDPWTTIDIHDTVISEMGIDLDLDDTELFGALLNHFNAGSWVCSDCGREYDDLKPGSPCPSDDCPSVEVV